MTYRQELITTLENYEGLTGFLMEKGNDEQNLLQDIMEKTVFNGDFGSNRMVNEIKQDCKRNRLRIRLRKKLEEKKKKEAEEKKVEVSS